MKFTGLALFSLICLHAFGQNKFGIKVYQNTDIFNITYTDIPSHQSRTSSSFNATRPSIAFVILSKRNLSHEIELIVPEVSKSTSNILFPYRYQFDTGEPRSAAITTLSFRYEINKTVKQLSEKINFNLGVGLNPYYVRIEYTPFTQSIYLHYYREYYSASLNIIPRLNFRLTNRFNVDLNVPFKFYDISKEIYHVDNPSIPYAQQTSSQITSNFFSQVYTVRLGVMYTFK